VYAIGLARVVALFKASSHQGGGSMLAAEASEKITGFLKMPRTCKILNASLLTAVFF
jgi:hypothetical protein